MYSNRCEKQLEIFLFGNWGWLSQEPISDENLNISLAGGVFAFRAGALVLRLKVVHATGELHELSLEALDLFTLGRSVFVDEVSHTFQAGQLQTVGVSEGEALHGSGTVVSGLGCLDLVVEKDDLGTGSSEDLVGGTELADNSIGIGFHCDRGWFGCDVHVAVISREYDSNGLCCSLYSHADASSEKTSLTESPHLCSFAKSFSHLSSLAALVVHGLASWLSSDIHARFEMFVEGVKNN